MRMLEMRAETPFSTWMRVFTSMRKGSPWRVTTLPRCPRCHSPPLRAMVRSSGRCPAAPWRHRSCSPSGGHEAGGHFHALLQAGGLDGAVAGAEVHGVLAAAVGHDLDFQVVEVREALFDEHALVLELAQGVVADAAVHGAEVVDVVHFLDAHAATAGRSLDQHQRALDALLAPGTRTRCGRCARLPSRHRWGGRNRERWARPGCGPDVWC